ncbi:ABC transporter ATP-binding protein [Aestuariimicrobium sp. Y1814]|uniref:ABC transporter ATP-binding protein n=1 Tax=Aestuariimicrobium sp. Y1814 TaxID=3418742 RepID=UPI003DA79FB4
MITAENWGWRHASRTTWAVQDASFTISEGERVLLLGASGSGKSTLLHALAGVIAGDEGEQAGRLLIDGRHPTRCIGRIGLVQQDPESSVVLARVGDDVAFGCENLQVPRDQIWPRVHQALDEVGLDVSLRHPTSALSGGQKQRLALAGAIAMQADILLLDEPTANLDPDGIDQVTEAVARAVSGRRRTLVVVEHRVETWLDLVDRVIVLGAGGGILADGPARPTIEAQRETLLAAGVWVPDSPPPIPGGDLARGYLPAGHLTGSHILGASSVFADTESADSEFADGESANIEEAVRAPGPAPHRKRPTILSGHDLSIGRHRDHVVASGLNVALPAGTSTVLTGANGAGKSTLALTLAGLLPPLAGQVRAAESLQPPARTGWRWRKTNPVDPTTWHSADLTTRIGTVFQEPEHQFVASTVTDELRAGPRALGWDEARIRARTDELMEALNLTRLAEANPFTLSGGEKRRLSVATVLATGPRVIVLDEPTFGQDRNTWAELVRLVADQVNQGAAVLSVTHDAAYLAALGQHHLRLSSSGLEVLHGGHTTEGAGR